MNRFDNINYYLDQRVIAASEKWFERLDEMRMVAYFLEDGYNEIEILCEWRVCPICGGRGSHVNPSIDANGLTGEDFADDPDFAESYMRGDYDQPCNGCNGKRVVPYPVHREDQKKVENYFREMAQMRAEHLAELRAGA
jgi:hypothetical protein